MGGVRLDTTEKGTKESTLNCGRIIRVCCQGKQTNQPTQGLHSWETLKACQEFAGGGCKDTLSSGSQTRGLLIRWGRGWRKMEQVASCCSGFNFAWCPLAHHSRYLKEKAVCTPPLPSPCVKAVVLLWVLLFWSPLQSFPGAMHSKQRSESSTKRFNLQHPKPKVLLFSLALWALNFIWHGFSHLSRKERVKAIGSWGLSSVNFPDPQHLAAMFAKHKRN